MTAYEAFAAEVANYLTGKLRPGLDPATYALGLLAEADLSQPEIHMEARGSHTASGNPLPMTFDVPPALRAEYQ